jgi:NAD(P)-dependent dehydrogenase (short-subunit alcohol dehydrogenase family)
LITGANSGIGFALATQLATAGVHVLIGCRNAKRAEEAKRLLCESVPGAQVSVLLIDVADPASISAAVQAITKGECIQGVAVDKITHLDYLFLNAGIMPSNRNRWYIALIAFFNGTLRYFMETGRAFPSSHHFVANPPDDIGACGAPAVFATHVLGHYMLAQQCEKLLQPLVHVRGSPRSDAWDKARGGRIIWTGSRAACAPYVMWEHLQPPSIDVPGQESGHQRFLKTGTPHGESYAEAKHAVDLLGVCITPLHACSSCYLI